MSRNFAVGLGIALALALSGTAQGGVIKTKTKSNQSNDRIAQAELAGALQAAFDAADLDRDGALDTAEQAALVKTKTKSNQSNDRCAGQCPADGGAEPARPGAPLKGVDVKLGRGAGSRELFVPISAGLDRDGNGQVSKSEWLAEGQAAIDLADEDRDGSLNAAEAAKAGWNIKSTEVR